MLIIGPGIFTSILPHFMRGKRLRRRKGRSKDSVRCQCFNYDNDNNVPFGRQMEFLEEIIAL